MADHGRAFLGVERSLGGRRWQAALDERGEALALAHYESSDQGTVLAATAPERAAHLTVTFQAGGRALAYLAEDLRGTGTFEASGQYLGTCEGD